MRIAARDYKRERKIPAWLVAEMAKATVLAQEAWVQVTTLFSQLDGHQDRVQALRLRVRSRTSGDPDRDPSWSGRQCTGLRGAGVAVVEFWHE